MFKKSNHIRLIRKGFTLVELIVVVGILGLLLGLILPRLKGPTDKTRDITAFKDLDSIQVACDNYVMNVGGTPVTWYSSCVTGTAGATGVLSNADSITILTDITSAGQNQTLDPKIVGVLADFAPKLRFYYSSQTDSVSVLQYCPELTSANAAKYTIVNGDKSIVTSVNGFNSAVLPHDTTDQTTDVWQAISSRAAWPYN